MKGTNFIQIFSILVILSELISAKYVENQKFNKALSKTYEEPQKVKIEQKIIYDLVNKFIIFFLMRKELKRPRAKFVKYELPNGYWRKYSKVLHSIRM